MSDSLPYHEPPPSTLLIQASFIFLLNAVNHVLDSMLSCGLVGQLLVGVAWGTPGGKLLSETAQDSIMQLGYIGLILIVFEGGLNTDFRALKANSMFSSVVALTGILVPIGLSFVLQSLINATPLQAFAAGAALCSTSLGTTFTLLSSSSLTTSRLGVVLTSAAMLDDVVGLIMVQVVSNLGSGSSLNAVTILRPVLVSLAFATVLPLACRYLVLPMTRWLRSKGGSRASFPSRTLLMRPELALTMHTAILFGLVSGTTYAGTSGLLGAYIAGAIISWWDGEMACLHKNVTTPFTADGSGDGQDGPSCVPREELTETALDPNSQVTQPNRVSMDQGQEAGSAIQGYDHQGAQQITKDVLLRPLTGAQTFATYYSPAVERILKPFFFGSIGFSIPITKMFAGDIVWRGLIYALLMMLGKVVCGVWLLPRPSPTVNVRQFQQRLKRRLGLQGRTTATSPTATSGSESKNTTDDGTPLSVYPGMLLGCAMVARGEIGYLISSLAESTGIYRDSSKGDGGGDCPSDVFLIATWAITVCTILGPVAVGVLTRRVRRLERAAANSSEQRQRKNVLGIWGEGLT